MVSLDEVTAGNSRVASTLPSPLIGVFAGATSGIGELALKGFAQYAGKNPRVYFIGRSEEAGERLKRELKEINGSGEYHFIAADVSLMKNVDEVCKKIKGKEGVINVLYMSQGTANLKGETSEGIKYLIAVGYYSRMRMALNLLPLIQAAPSLRRVVTTMSAGFEGKLYIDHIADGKVPFTDARPHMTSLTTIGLEALAERYPTVSFVHNFPGAVKTNFIRPEDGMIMRLAGLWFSWTLRNQWIGFDEVRERHAWLCLSGNYTPKESDGSEEGMVVIGSDGEKGSGVYSIGKDGESSGERPIEVLKGLRKDGMVLKVWEDLERQFIRITGETSI